MLIRNNIEQFSARSSTWYFKSLCVQRELDPWNVVSYVVEIVLSDGLDENSDVMQLKCWNVRDMQIPQIDGLFSLCLSIEDVRDRQLEGISYRVCDLVDDVFTFFCSDFECQISVNGKATIVGGMQPVSSLTESIKQNACATRVKKD